jgi:hypothetical protein
MTTAISCDKTIIDQALALSLPFYEGAGVITQDIAQPHHPVALNGPPSWTPIASGLGTVEFNGATDYLDCLAADSADLDIIAQDYSIVGWINYQITGLSQIVIGRYGVDLDGWEVYLYDVNNTLNLRHHHASLVPTRTGCYSIGWATGTWHLFGISRSGAYPLMYRNGEEMEMSYSVGGLSNPDTCNRDLVIGTRYTKDANWYEGMMWNPRFWLRALEPWEHRAIWDSERGLFAL